jgi:hypothetical protein
VPFHYLSKDLTGDRARALIAEDIPTFRISTDVTYVPPLASQNNSISLQENIGESSFWASLAPLVTSSPDPANQIPQSQNAELNNSAPNSSIAQIAQLSISATVPDSLENQENSLASNKKLKYYQNDPNPRIEHNLARTAKLLRPIRVRPGNRPRKEPKLTQLERIYKSIYGLYLTSSLEVIKHHYFAPWNRTTPYQVVISKSTKEDEAKAHNTFLESLLVSDTTTIYTDASSTEKGKGIGVGIVVYNHSDWNKQATFRKSYNIGTSQLVYNGELEGVTLAIEYASIIATEGDTFIVYSDNQAGI